MGAKKGMGATKVQTNFEDLEREAEMADSLRSQKAAEANKPEEIESQVRKETFCVPFFFKATDMLHNSFIYWCSFRRVRSGWLIKTWV